MIPHNYKESSYPVAVFIWSVENTGDTEVDVSLMFSFQNGVGSECDTMGDHCNQLFHSKGSDKPVTGVLLVHKQVRQCSRATQRMTEASVPREGKGSRVLRSPVVLHRGGGAAGDEGLL